MDYPPIRKLYGGRVLKGKNHHTPVHIAAQEQVHAIPGPDISRCNH